MRYLIIGKILGLLIAAFSLIATVPPMIVALIYAESTLLDFAASAAIMFAIGAGLWFACRGARSELRNRDGFLITVLFWTVLGLAGAVPLWLDDSVNLSATDAVFESLSGLTTTGATVISGLDDLPRSLLFYRQLLQWMGGIGIIVLAMAVLPFLGVGGMQMYRAETPGPMKDAKLAPRIVTTAVVLASLYSGLTLACGLAYYWAGMNAFDAIAHAFSTIAIGGFSTKDASLGHFDSAAIEMVAIVFMILAGINFALHFTSYKSLKNALAPGHRRTRVMPTFMHYVRDSESRGYLIFLAVLCVVVVGTLIGKGTYEPAEALRKGVFETVSVATTTGFATADYSTWPTFLPFLLLMSAFAGACAGSTGGGIKQIRMILLFKQGAREIRQLIHPNAVIAVKLGGKSVPETVVGSIWGFLAAYIFLFALLMLLMMAAGTDPITAYSAVGACINNLGPGLGEVALTYGTLGGFEKWILCLAMLLGRLELFTLLVVLTPEFWRA
ncbi:MAG: TrkH family potassium uptake protein [Litorivicinus sp.]